MNELLLSKEVSNPMWRQVYVQNIIIIMPSKLLRDNSHIFNGAIKSFLYQASADYLTIILSLLF